MASGMGPWLEEKRGVHAECTTSSRSRARDTCPSPGTFGSRKSEGDAESALDARLVVEGGNEQGGRERKIMAAGSRGDAGKSPRRGPSALRLPRAGRRPFKS